MKLFVFVVVVLCSPSFVLTDSGLRGPPHVVGEMVAKYYGKVGDTLKLDCPIDSGTNPGLSVYYEWYKDGEAITSAWERFRVISRKLRIKGVVAEDGGRYACKAVNGFGSKELSTKLVVQDESGTVVGGFEEETSEEKNSPDEIMGMRPRITEVTQPLFGTTFRQTVGSSLTLRCKVDGQPFPRVSWFKLKDGVQLPRVNGQQLDLTYINFADNGTYVCRAENTYGQVNASFTLEVVVFTVEESDPLLPIGVLIAIPSTLMVLFTGLALVICCVRRAQNGESSVTPTVTTTTTYATPRDVTNDYHTPHHPPHPFYNPHSSLRNNCGARDGVQSGPPHLLPISTQPYFTKENISSSTAKGHCQVPHLASPAYAIVPICETSGSNNTSTFGINNCRAPPLPSRPNFNPSCRGDRNTYNNQGLLTQPLLTQTASSSDSRDSRQSASYRAEFTNHRPVDHWCSSGGSDASSERKHSKNHQIRL